jgi:hypothetical protein
MRKLLIILMALVAAVSGCAYESSGTTTTTRGEVVEEPPPTGPADLAFGDQLIEGSGVVLESVTMPAPGFVVLQADDSGGAGEVLGVSELIGEGRISSVPVAFFLPIEEPTRVHATLHIDMDRDRFFTYEPPDSFIDAPATFSSGGLATAAAEIGLLAAVGPAELEFLEQRTDGEAVVVASVDLPAPGFLAIQVNEGGEPGRVLGITGLLPAGISTDLEIALDPPLLATGIVFAVPYVDRDADGIADITGEEPVDGIARRADGTLLLTDPVITVIRRQPTVLEVADQEGEGAAVVVAAVTLPAAGVVEVRADSDGSPGRLLGLSDLLPRGTTTDIEIELDRPLVADARLWIRVRIDFDEDGTLSEGDPFGLTESGERAATSLDYTLPEEEDEEDDGADT